MTGKIKGYLLSIPERAFRSVTALASGIVREIGEVVVPAAVKRSHLYRTLVDVTLRFLIEQVGQVEGVYPGEEKLSEDFLLRRTAGNGIELIGVLTFSASPVWVLAALADASGAGRHLIREISNSLKDEGLLDRKTEFSSVDQMLDGLEASASKLATTINTPPLDIKTLREEWAGVRRELARIPPANLPPLKTLGDVWEQMKNEAQRQNKTTFQISSLMAMSVFADLPQKMRWLSASARNAAGKTGSLLAGVLLDHYQATLTQIREQGYIRYAVRQFRPYLYGAVSQFSPKKGSLTERFLNRR